MAEVGGEIKRRRDELDWSQPQLAVRAGVAVSAVSQIENGRRSPNVGTLEKIASALGVEIADLFPKAQAPLQLEEPEQGGASERYYTAYEALGRILASNWEDAGKAWSEKIPTEGLIDGIDFGRLLEWTLEINSTLSVYRVVARDSSGPQRAEMEDTLRLMENAVSEAFQLAKRAYEPVKTYTEFRKIWEENDLDAAMSEVQSN